MNKWNFYSRALCWRTFASYLLLPGLVLLTSTQPAAGRIKRIEITSIQSPTFGGTVFGAVGQYQKLVGKAYGEVAPTDPHNSTITDIGLAPKNNNGMVEYSMDIYILRPVDMSKGN